MILIVESGSTKADWVLLDNFSLPDIRTAVATYANQAKLEVSGNITLENLEQYAETGVNRISIGALTKNISALDLSLRLLAV